MGKGGVTIMFHIYLFVQPFLPAAKPTGHRMVRVVVVVVVDYFEVMTLKIDLRSRST